MTDSPKGLNQLNRVLLQTLMSKDAANIVADRLEELERENAALRATLEQIRLAWTTQAEACSDHSDLAFRMAQWAFNAKATIDAERKDNNK